MENIFHKEGLSSITEMEIGDDHVYVSSGVIIQNYCNSTFLTESDLLTYLQNFNPYSYSPEGIYLTTTVPYQTMLF